MAKIIAGGEMAYCVKQEGRILIDTVYEGPMLSKWHFLCFNSGDYDEDDFINCEGGPWAYKVNAAFKQYPNAQVIAVDVSEKQE